MLTKILTGGFVLIMLGAVVAGAIAIFAPSQEACTNAELGERGIGLGQAAQGGGQGRGARYALTGSSREGRGAGTGGWGQSIARDQGQGQGQDVGQGRGGAVSLETEAVPLEQETIEGVVVETVEMVVETSSGETIQVGLGPSFYRESQGFVLQVNDNVRVSGFWEDDEFKATQLENLDTGQSIFLRDNSGRPVWAGQGRGRNRSS